MLKHLVSWKLSSDDAETRREQTDRIVVGLRALEGLVPSIRALSVGPTAVNGPNHWDIGLIVDFDDESGLADYQVHPDHQAIGGYIVTVVAQQATVDFLV